MFCQWSTLPHHLLLSCCQVNPSPPIKIPDGEGQVKISKVDIDAGSIDGTPIGQDSTSSGSFTTLISSGNTNVGGFISVGDSSSAGVIMSNSDQDITIKTGNSNTGSITITDGENGDISITPDGLSLIHI
mgnify:CR=1 FL=1